MRQFLAGQYRLKYTYIGLTVGSTIAVFLDGMPTFLTYFFYGVSFFGLLFGEVYKQKYIT